MTRRPMGYHLPCASAWALFGVAALFTSAIYRLGSHGLATLRQGLSGAEWFTLILLTTGLIYGEGYRALERRWVPRVLRRARSLGSERSAILRLLAPLYSLSLIGGPRSELARAWAATLAIVAAVLLVRAFPEPWRGITDFSVAAALGWGLVAMLRGVPSVRGA